MSDLRDQIAAALLAHQYARYDALPPDPPEVMLRHQPGYVLCAAAFAQADAVLAVVEAHTRAVQAQALRDAARVMRRMADHGADGEATPHETAEWLNHRADALDPRPEEDHG